MASEPPIKQASALLLFIPPPPRMLPGQGSNPSCRCNTGSQTHGATASLFDFHMPRGGLKGEKGKKASLSCPPFIRDTAFPRVSAAPGQRSTPAPARVCRAPGAAGAPVAVVGELVVAGEGDEHPQADPQREAYLDGGVYPDLRKRDGLRGPPRGGGRGAVPGPPTEDRAPSCEDQNFNAASFWTGKWPGPRDRGQTLPGAVSGAGPRFPVPPQHGSRSGPRPCNGRRRRVGGAWVRSCHSHCFLSSHGNT